MDYQAVACRAAEQMRSYRKDPSGWRSCKRTVSHTTEAQGGKRGGGGGFAAMQVSPAAE